MNKIEIDEELEAILNKIKWLINNRHSDKVDTNQIKEYIQRINQDLNVLIFVLSY